MLLGSGAALFFQKLVCAIFPKPIFAQADFQKYVRAKFPKRIFAQTHFLQILCLVCFPQCLAHVVDVETIGTPFPKQVPAMF